MAIEYKAFSGEKEIDGFYSGGKEIQEIWGGDTLLWRKKEDLVEEDIDYNEEVDDNLNFDFSGFGDEDNSDFEI